MTLANRNDVLGKGIATQNVGDKSELLGYIVSFSIGEASYKREDMEQSLVLNGLDTSYLPNPVNPEDAFKRAVKGCEVKSWKAKPDSDEYINIMARDVVRAGAYRLKKLVIETVNAGKENITHDSAAELRFDMKTEQMTTSWTEPVCMALVDKAEEQFKEFLTTHNGNTVRGSVTKLLNTMSPILMRQTGGVYFVPIQYEDKILSTIRYINSLDKGDAFSIPMVNDADGQQLLKKKFEEHLQNVLDDCRKVIAAHEGEIDDESPANQKKRKELEKKALETAMLTVQQFKDYKAILEGEISQVESAFELVKNAVHTMTNDLAIKPVKKRK